MTSRILAVTNQKGGVGKTSLTLGLAGAVAESGRRVLVIDMDPQANASQTLLDDHDDLLDRDDFFTTNDIMEKGVDPADIYDAIRPSDWTENIHVIPSRQELANREAEGTTGIETRLRRMLRGLDSDLYDVILLDCPPSVGHLTVNALICAQEVLLVTVPAEFGWKALSQVDETLKTIRESHDHDIEVAGLVVNMYDHTTDAEKALRKMQERFGDRLLLVLPRRVDISKAVTNHESVFAMKTRGAREVVGWYTGLAQVLGLTDGVPETVPTAQAAPTAVRS